MVKLYLPYGTLRHPDIARGASVHWFRHGRRETPVAPYETLILGYKQLKPDEQERAEAMVDEMFTDAEFQALRAYLYESQPGADLRTSMMVPPISSTKQENERNRGLVRPFSICEEGESGGFYRLTEQPGYALPFPVWGYFTHPVR